MNAAKRIGCALLACCICSMSSARVWDEQAKMLLLKSLERAYNVNVRAVVVQYCPETKTLQQIKLEQSKTGRARYTVLAPLRDQGEESVDDGTRCVTYLPDNKLILIQASTRNVGLEPRERMDCAEKNYRMTAEHVSEIAGRPTVCITATPKSTALEERRFYIDTETAYLLRTETVTRNGEKIVKYDTKSVTYPAELMVPSVAVSAFGAKTIRYEHQAAFSEKGSPVSPLGFTPVIPRELPYGFRVTGTQITRSESWEAAIVRLTDGLVIGAVYEWKQRDNMRAPEAAPDRSAIRAHGLNLLMVADIPKDARNRILRAFADAGAQAKLQERDSLELEPNRGGSMFNNIAAARTIMRMQQISTD